MIVEWNGHSDERVASGSRRVARRLSLPACGLWLAASLACATAPPAPVATKPTGPTFEQKMSAILRLEDQRMLRDPAAPPAPPPPPAAPVRGRQPAAAPAPPPPPPPPDLVRMLSDQEPRVRRRAALAIGHVGLADGVQPLLALLADPDPEVRQMAAFALGLIGDARARDRLVAALADPSPLVQGSAAEALGLIGDAAAADAIGRFVAQGIQSGVVAQQSPPAEDDARRDTPAAAGRLGIFPPVRLKAYGPLSPPVPHNPPPPRVPWGPPPVPPPRAGGRR